MRIFNIAYDTYQGHFQATALVAGYKVDQRLYALRVGARNILDGWLRALFNTV